MRRKPHTINSGEMEFEKQFKEMIKNIIREEEYVTNNDIKTFIKETLEELNPLISKHIKEHLVIIAKYIIDNFQTQK